MHLRQAAAGGWSADGRQPAASWPVGQLVASGRRTARGRPAGQLAGGQLTTGRPIAASWPSAGWPTGRLVACGQPNCRMGRSDDCCQPAASWPDG